MQSNLFFQYCQKLVVLSADKKSVLLAKRAGEADYDEVFSFIGGKMETTDESFIAGMQREKNEEIGSEVRINLVPDETYNLLFRKKDGSTMVIPHIACIYVSGKISLNDEYSEYQWVQIDKLETFEPKIKSVVPLAHWAIDKLRVSTKPFVEI